MKAKPSLEPKGYNRGGREEFWGEQKRTNSLRFKGREEIADGFVYDWTVCRQQFNLDSISSDVDSCQWVTYVFIRGLMLSDCFYTAETNNIKPAAAT